MNQQPTAVETKQVIAHKYHPPTPNCPYCNGTGQINGGGEIDEEYTSDPCVCTKEKCNDAF